MCCTASVGAYMPCSSSGLVSAQFDAVDEVTMAHSGTASTLRQTSITT